MLNELKILLNIKLLLPCLFILVSGVSAGIFCGSILPAEEMNYFISLLRDHLTTSGPHFLPSAITNLLFLLLIFLSGYSIYGFPLALLLLFIRTFSTGFCDCLLLYSIDQSGILQFIFSFLLPQLILCTVYFAVTVFSISLALSKHNSRP